MVSVFPLLSLCLLGILQGQRAHLPLTSSYLLTLCTFLGTLRANTFPEHALVNVFSVCFSWKWAHLPKDADVRGSCSRKWKSWSYGATCTSVVANTPVFRAIERGRIHLQHLPFLARRKSETGRARFRRVRFQTPNSVSFLPLTDLRGENSVSSSQPIV